MKVLKILAVVFGALLLLAGAGLLVGSYAVGQGNNALQGQMASSGLSGPVDGVVQVVDGQRVTVDYTDEGGDDHIAEGQAALTRPVKPGDTVSVYYSPDQPDIVVVTDITGGSLTALARGLRTGGIISLVVGGLLLLGGILGLVLGKKTPAVAGGPGSTFAPQPYPGQPYPGQQVPGQQFAGQQFPGQPIPGQPYPPQGPAYGQPPEAYGQQPGQPYGNPDQPAPGRPAQLQYPDQPPYSAPPSQPDPPQWTPSEPPSNPPSSDPPSNPPPSG